MDEDLPRKKKKTPVWKRVFSVVAVIAVIYAVAAALLLHILADGLPPLAADWLREKLSSGSLCFTFDRASFTISKGIHIENPRVYAKHTPGPPLVSADEVDIDFKFHADRPAYTWASEVSVKGFVLKDIPQGISDGEGDGENRLAAFMMYTSVENEWLTTPVPLHFDRAHVLGFDFKRIDALASIYGGKLLFDKVSADFDSAIADETGTGSVRFDPVTSTLTARFISLALPPSVTGLMELLEMDTILKYFRDMHSYTIPFSVNGDIRWKFETADSPSEKDIRISVDSSDYAFRSTPISNLKLNMQYLSPGTGGDYTKRVAIINPVVCRTDRGTVSSALAYYPDLERMDFTLNSSAPLEYLLDLGRQERPDALTNLVAAIPPEIKFAGNVRFAGDSNTVTGRGDFAYQSLSLFGIPFSGFSSEVSAETDVVVSLQNISAGFFGGQLEGNLHVKPEDETDVPFIEADFTLSDAKSPQIFKYFGQQLQDGKGIVNASGEISGFPSMEKLDSLTGRVDVRIRDTHLLRIPLFAGLTEFLAKHVPGIDEITSQDEADFSAGVTNGLVTVSDFKLQGHLFSIISDNARCRLNKEGMPIEGVAKLRFFKQKTVVGVIMRVITLPVSKMMEFRITGPVKKPEWNYIGLIDRVIGIFKDQEDATAPDPAEPANIQEEKK